MFKYEIRRGLHPHDGAGLSASDYVHSEEWIYWVFPGADNGWCRI